MEDDHRIMTIFMQFLQAMGHSISSVDHLLDGLIIGEFLSSVQDSNLSPLDLNLQKDDPQAQKNNFGLIIDEIVRLRSSSQFFNVHFMANEPNIKQLNTILKECLMIAIKAPNNSDYIEKIMTLCEQSQVQLVQLLKDKTGSNPTTPSRSPKEETPQRNAKLQNSEELKLIDRVYELEQEVDRLNQELKKFGDENGFLQEKVKNLEDCRQCLKNENQSLKGVIGQLEESVENLVKRKEFDCQIEEKYTQNRIELESISEQYKAMLSKIKSEKEAKIQEIQSLLKHEKEKGFCLLESIETLEKEIYEWSQKCSTLTKQLKNTQQELSKATQKNLVLQENEAVLKFEINYKNTQIQELKESLMNASNANCSQEEHFLNRQQKNSRLLQSEFMQTTLPRPSLEVNSIEVKNLRFEVSELKKQLQDLKDMKIKNRELQYEKKKYIKILKQYEKSRGQENQILAGCLYELRTNFHNNGNKIFDENKVLAPKSENF